MAIDFPRLHYLIEESVIKDGSAKTTLFWERDALDIREYIIDRDQTLSAELRPNYVLGEHGEISSTYELIFRRKK